MKTTKVISGFLSILVVLALTMTYAEEEKAYVPKDNEEIYGTWINEDYPGGLFGAQKMTIHPDRTYEVFAKTTDTTSRWGGTMTIIDKWTDSEGSIWYKTHRKSISGRFWYGLDKISSSGSIYEYVQSHVDHPTEMDTGHYRYRIYYRK